MTSETIAALRAELEAQKASLAPRIEGMNDIVRVGNGVEGEKGMRAAAEEAASAYTRRVAIIDRALGVLHDLENDGYPALPKRRVSERILQQLDANLETFMAARDEFELAAIAVAGVVDFGAGTVKPEFRNPGT